MQFIFSLPRFFLVLLLLLSIQISFDFFLFRLDLCMTDSCPVTSIVTLVLLILDIVLFLVGICFLLSRRIIIVDPIDLENVHLPHPFSVPLA